MTLTLATVPHKTEQGKQQIAERSVQLPARMRQLFLMIDGKKTIEQLLNMGFSSLNTESFEELEKLGMISTEVGAAQQTSPTPAPSAASGSIAQEQSANTMSLSDSRYKIIDLVLDSCGFSARDFVEELERADSLSGLRTAVSAFLEKGILGDESVKAQIRKAAGIS